MKTDNTLLKGIAKNTGSQVSGTHTDNYYLKRIEANTKNGGGSGSGSGFSGDYNDLTNKPDLSNFVTSGDLSDFVTSEDLSTYATKQDLNSKTNVADFDTLEVEITYQDESTTTVSLYCCR